MRFSVSRIRAFSRSRSISAFSPSGSASASASCSRSFASRASFAAVISSRSVWISTGTPLFFQSSVMAVGALSVPIERLMLSCSAVSRFSARSFSTA